MGAARERKGCVNVAHKPTAEQDFIYAEWCKATESAAVRAYAGTGKTTTAGDMLRLTAQELMLYITFNKQAQLEADGRFGRVAKCRTMNSLAWDYRFRSRCYPPKGTPRLRGRDQAKVMRIIGAQRLAERVLAPEQLAPLVMRTLRNYSYSADETILARHVPKKLNNFTREDLAVLQEVIPPIARRMWTSDIISPAGVLPFCQDFLVKMWALTRPRLPFDRIIIDEAQDTNPCFAAVMDAQRHAMRWYIGDGYQQLYAFRGAVSALDRFDVDVDLHLTQSFRFGPAVASEANVWLRLLGAPAPLIGTPGIPSVIGAFPHPDAILCRTNAEAILQVMDQLEAGRRVAVAGGVSELKNLTLGARDLQNGKPAEHPDLYGFTTWGQVQDFVDSDDPDAEDLQVFVRLVDKHSPDGLLAILEQVVDKPENADVVVSTIHKAKGLEYDRIRIGEDFNAPKPGSLLSPETGRLTYVGVTRAKLGLDESALKGLHEWVAEGGRCGTAEEPIEPAAWPAAGLAPVPAPPVAAPAVIAAPVAAAARPRLAAVPGTGRVRPANVPANFTDHCSLCGFDFKKWQTRQTCKVQGACLDRQAKLAAAAS